MSSADKLIRAGDLFKAVCEDTSIRGSAFAAIRRHIETAPAVEAEEVAEVRKFIENAEAKGSYCVECGFCYYNSSNGTFKCRSMNGMNRTVEPNDFCSYGERKVK